MRKNNVNLSIIKLRSIIKHATAINTPKISTERKKDQERFQFGPFLVPDPYCYNSCSVLR